MSDLFGHDEATLPDPGELFLSGPSAAPDEVRADVLHSLGIDSARRETYRGPDVSALREELQI